MIVHKMYEIVRIFLKHLRLNEQTFFEIARAHARRVELLYKRQNLLEILHDDAFFLSDNVERSFNVTIVIDVTNENARDHEFLFVKSMQVHLPFEVIKKRLRI